MKKFLCLALALVAVSFFVAAKLISQNEGLVGGALSELKFESVPGNPKLVGAPPQFKVSKQTIEFLEKLRKDHKTIEVQGDGALRIK